MEQLSGNPAQGAWAKRAFDSDWRYLQGSAPEQLPAVPYWMPDFIQRAFDNTTYDLRTY